MVLTLLVSLKQRAQRDVLEPSVRSLPKLRAVLDRAAERAGWEEVAINRLQGIWVGSTLTPLERPSEHRGRATRSPNVLLGARARDATEPAGGSAEP